MTGSKIEDFIQTSTSVISARLHSLAGDFCGFSGDGRSLDNGESMGMREKRSTYGLSMHEGRPAKVVKHLFQVPGSGGLEKL